MSNTLEQSLKLHDAFSNVLEKINSGLTNTLGTFEKFQNVLNQDVRAGSTDKLQQDLERTNQTIDKVSNQVENLTSKMDELTHLSTNQTLIQTQPTVSALEQIDSAVNKTATQLNELNEQPIDVGVDKAYQSFDNMNHSIGNAADQLDHLTYKINGLNSYTLEMNTDTIRQDFEKTQQTIDAVDNQMDSLAGKFNNFSAANQSMVDPQSTVSALSQIDSEAAKTLNRLGELGNQPIDFDTSPAQQEFTRVANQVDMLASKIEGLANQQVNVDTNQMQSEFQQTNQAVDKVIGRMDALIDKIAETSNQQINIDTNQMQQSFDRSNEAVDKVTNQVLILTSKIEQLFSRTSTQPLIQSQATVSALKQIDLAADLTKDQLDEMYFKFEDQAGRAQQAIDLVTDKMRLQGQEIMKIEKLLSEEREYGNADNITKYENALNRLETSYLNNMNKVDKYREKLMGLENSMMEVEQAQARLGQSQGLDQQQSKIQRAIVHAQTLIDKFKQTNPAIIAINHHTTNLKNRIQQSAIAQTRFGQAVSKSVGFVTRLSGSTARLPFVWMKLIPIIGNAIQKQRQLRSEVDKTAQSQNKLNGLTKLLSFGVAIMALRQVNDLLDRAAAKADQITQTIARLNIMNDGAQTIDQLNDKVMAAAIDSRSAWQDTADFVSKVGINAGEAFANNDEIIAFTNLLQKSYKAGGASAEEQRSSMTQLTQALQMGVLRGEELNSVMAGAPLVIDAITKHLGITKAELKELSSEGKISASVIKTAMFAAADDINAKFQEIPMTWEDMWTQTHNVALYAFLPLVEAFNEFINSAPGQLLFEHLSKAFIMIAEVSMWAFELVVAGIEWVQENINKVMLAFTILAGIIATVALVMAVSWAVANWQILLTIIILISLINMFDGVGVTAENVLGYMAGGFAFLAVVIYDVILFVIGLFTALFQHIYNSFYLFVNHALAVAEFFMNVWNHPVYATRKLFHNLATNVLNFMGAIADGSGKAGVVLGNAFINGANIAIQGINWIIDALNKIPGIDIGNVGTIGNISTSTELGDGIRGLADIFDPGESPEGYKSLEGYRVNMTAVDGLTNALGSMKNPISAFNMAYEKASNLSSGATDFFDGFNKMIDGNTGMLKGIKPEGGAGKGLADKLGKGKEIGDVGKIKSDVTITDEDLKYLRDIAERNFIIRYQQLTPNATVHLHGSGHTEADARKLLEEMEDMIEEAVATNLA